MGLELGGVKEPATMESLDPIRQMLTLTASRFRQSPWIPVFAGMTGNQ